MAISFYDRKKEPEEIKRVEGATVPWGVKEAIKKVGKGPDVIYHKGDVGKEPMIVIFGEQACDLAKLIVQLAREIGKKERKKSLGVWWYMSLKIKGRRGNYNKDNC